MIISKLRRKERIDVFGLNTSYKLEMELLTSILQNMPDALSLGLVWGIMAIGVYITFKVLDIPDMTVDGTFALGGCIVAATITTGVNPVISMVLAVICGMAA